MAKKKLKFRPRRKFDMGATFRNRTSNKEQEEQRQSILMGQELRQVFPNEEERQTYIKALFDGMTVKGIDDEEIDA